MADKENKRPKSKPCYVLNRRGNDQLIDSQNHLYHVDQRKGCRCFWVCAEKKTLGCRCTAVVVKLEVDGVPIEYVTFAGGQHNHLSNLAKIKANSMDHKTVAHALANLSAPPSRIVSESTDRFKDEETSTAVLLERRKAPNIIRSIQRQRAKAKGHSAVPVSMNAIASTDLPEKYGITEMGDKFLLIKDHVSADDPSKCFLMFISPLQKEIARMAKRWFHDGTFKTCPPPFTIAKGRKGQIYTSFAELETGSVLPFCFTILPDKTSESYARMWTELHKELTNGGKVPLSVTSVGMDYEVAPKKEFDKVFPDVHMSGCFFHWRQALNRQLSKKGCTRFHNENLAFQEIVAKCIALAYVPPDEIHEYSWLIEESWEKVEESMTHEAAEWLLYFNTTYVGNLNSRTGRRKQPKFCHTSWNKYNEVLDSESTTSNKAEAWNKAYGVRSDPNTSFWGALDSFRREEALAVRKFREETINVRSQAAAATEGNARQIKQREKDALLRNVVLKATVVPKSEYLEMLAAVIRNKKSVVPII